MQSMPEQQGAPLVPHAVHAPFTHVVAFPQGAQATPPTPQAVSSPPDSQVPS